MTKTKTKIPLLLVVVFLALDAEAVWLDLPSSGTKCVSEEIQPNVVALADYSVIYKGHTHSAINIAIKQTPHIWHQLALFFRDELLSWSWRRPLGVPSPQVATEWISSRRWRLMWTM